MLALAGCVGMGVAVVLIALCLARRNMSLIAQSSEQMSPQDLLKRMADLAYRCDFDEKVCRTI